MGHTCFFALFFSVVIMITAAMSYADDDKDQGDGLFSKGSFLSEAISSATDKLNRVSSGEERIADENAKGVPDDIMEYDGDPFRRSGSGFTREEYRRNREMSEEMKKRRADEKN